MSREVAEKKTLSRQYGSSFGPVHAMLWELWQHSCWEFLFRTFGPIMLWGFFFNILNLYSPVGDALFYPVSAFIFTMITSLMSILWMSSTDNIQDGFKFHFGFSRPISTIKLVTVPMLYMSGTAAVSYLVPMGYLRIVFDIPFPLLPAAAIVCTASAVIFMAAWSSQSRIFRSFCLNVSMIIFVSFLWFRVKGKVEASGETFLSPDLMIKISTLSLLDYLLLLVIYVASITFTVFAIDRQRHGECLRIGWPTIDRTDLSYNLLRWIKKPFLSRRQAQYWYEMRRSGVPLLLHGLGASVVFFFVFIALNAVILDVGGVISLLSWPVFMSPLIFLLPGTEWLLGLRYHEDSISLPLFDATQAMGNSGLMAIKFFVLFTCVFLSCIFVVVAAAVWTFFWGDYHLWIDTTSTIQKALTELSLPYWGCIGLVLFISSSSITALIMTGWLYFHRYPMFLLVVIVMGFVYLNMYVWDTYHGGIGLFWETHAWLISVLLFILTINLWRKALREEYLHYGHLGLSVCLWIIYTCAAVALCLRLIPGNQSGVIPYFVYVLGISSLILPLILVAAMPLSLALHRHR